MRALLACLIILASAATAEACISDLRELRPYCNTVLECHRVVRGIPQGQSPNLEFDVQRQCDLARTCQDKVKELCPLPHSRQSGPIWKNNATARHFSPINEQTVRDLKRAACVSVDELADPECAGDTEFPRFVDPIKLTELIYNQRCDSIHGCIRRLRDKSNLWQEQLENARVELRLIERGQINDRTNTANQVSAVIHHASVLSGATELVAQAVHSKRDSTKDEQANPSSLSSATQNIAHATNGVATANKQIAEAIDELGLEAHEGLNEIATAIEIGLLGRPTPTSGIARQIDPEADFEEIYTDADAIEYGVLLVPDPRIPRHRRAYELSVHAVMRGMLSAGFVLDRYSVPWQQYLDDPKYVAPVERGGSQLVDDGKFGVLVFRRDDYRRNNAEGFIVRALYVVGESGSFGVQREAFANAVGRAHWKALGRDGCLPQRALTFDNAPIPGSFTPTRQSTCPPDQLALVTHEDVKPVLVIGPAFSGSMSSIASAFALLRSSHKRYERIDRVQHDAFRKLEAHLRHARADAQSDTQLDTRCRARERRKLALFTSEFTALLAEHRPRRVSNDGVKRLKERWKSDAACKPLSAAIQMLRGIQTRPGELPTMTLVSAAATSSSNEHAAKRYGGFSYRSFAVPDDVKLENLHARLVSNGVLPEQPNAQSRDVAIFSEASVFGSGVCADESKLELCQRALEVHFPANIADIRHGARERERRAEAIARDALGLPNSHSLLDLAPGAENGSEFPESTQASTTIASAELELEQAIRHIKINVRPRIVVIAATDVRDRIFLMQRLRGELPQALFIDLEADVLMSHSSVAHATRGAVMLASHPLEFEIHSHGQTPSYESFSTDDQALLFCLVRSLGIEEKACTRWCNQSTLRISVGFPPLFHTATTRSLADASEKALEAKLAGRGAVFMSLLALVLFAFVLFAIVLSGTLPGEGGPTPGASSTMRAWMPLITWMAGFTILLLSSAVTEVLLLTTNLACLGYVFWASVRTAKFAPGWNVWTEMTLTQLPLCLLSVATAVASGPAVWNLYELMGSSAGSIFDGVSLPLLTAVVIGSVLLTTWLLCWRADFIANGDKEPPTRFVELIRDPQQLLVRYVRLPRGPIGAVGVLALLPLIVVVAPTISGPRLHFVPYSAWVAWASFAATALLGLLAWTALLQAAMWLSELRRFSGRLTMRMMQALPSADGKFRLGDWAVLPTTALVHNGSEVRLRWIPPFFRESPFNADEHDWLPSLKFLGITQANAFVGGMAEISQQYVDSLTHRTIAATLAAYLVRRIRLCFYGAFVAAGALIACGYAWPISARDGLLLVALGYLLLGAFGFCYALIWCERNEALSRLLSNTSGRTDISWTFISAFLTPFVILALAIVVLEMPGVMQWGGGLIRPILEHVGW